MRTVLFLSLIVLCLNAGLLGGYTLRSFEENDLGIYRAFQSAAEDYTKSNNGYSFDDLIPLTVYSQVVSGTNYKICFINSKDKYQNIFEYVIYKPISGNEYNVNKMSKLQQSGGLLNFNDQLFGKIQDTLKEYLKDTVTKLNFLSYAYPIENSETIFYIASAYTEKGDHIFVLPYHKNTEKYADPIKIN